MFLQYSSALSAFGKRQPMPMTAIGVEETLVILCRVLERLFAQGRARLSDVLAGDTELLQRRKPDFLQKDTAIDAAVLAHFGGSIFVVGHQVIRRHAEILEHESHVFDRAWSVFD